MSDSHEQSAIKSPSYIPPAEKSDAKKNIPQAAPSLEEKKELPSKENVSCYIQNYHITMLPEDVMNHILSYLKANELEYPTMVVCRWFREASNTNYLWKRLCTRTGKIYPTLYMPPFIQNNANSDDGLSSTAPEESSEGRNDHSSRSSTLSDDISSIALSSNESVSQCNKNNPYRQFYYRNPCVPTDLKTIQEAVDCCPPEGHITILPGLYFEHIRCINKHRITIRAAFPHIGAALIHRNNSTTSNDIETRTNMNEPCIFISGDCSEVVISHLQTLHSSPGIDIWAGNCVVLCDNSSSLHLCDCSLQSDSGRGVVVTGKASLIMSRCVVHDCAATGLYIGDLGTTGFIYGSTIIENGFGSERPLSRRRRRTFLGNIDDQDEDDWASDEDIDEINNIQEEDHDLRQNVPPGHSGMYVETANAIIRDCMISGNSLTGLSVVRRGRVQLSGSDLTENGAEPVTVEEIPHLDATRNGRMDEGGIVLGPDKNNFSNIDNGADISTNEFSQIILGGRIRVSSFMDAIHDPVTVTKLKQKYQKYQNDFRG